MLLIVMYCKHKFEKIVSWEQVIEVGDSVSRKFDIWAKITFRQIVNSSFSKRGKCGAHLLVTTYLSQSDFGIISLIWNLIEMFALKIIRLKGFNLLPSETKKMVYNIFQPWELKAVWYQGIKNSSSVENLLPYHSIHSNCLKYLKLIFEDLRK